MTRWLAVPTLMLTIKVPSLVGAFESECRGIGV
jgi:hypothetical protein